MTDEQINAAIAKELGWTQVEAIHRSGRAPDATYVGREFIPNYCADHNAMHEAQKILGKNRINFIRNLAKICDYPLPAKLTKKWFWVCDATARQRAEAFLRTLGKWEEAK